MNNLFLREKESWSIWLIWGVVSAIAVYITASQSHSISHIVFIKLGVFSLLTWYMAYLKRFSFWRAMKISLVVFSIAVTPVLFFNFEALSLLKNADFIKKIIFLLAITVIFSLICSLIARQPKEYY